MQEKLLELIYRLGARHGRALLIAFALLTVVAGGIATRLTISSSQQALLPPTHPVQRQYQEFVAEFGSVDSLIVVLEGEPETLKGAAELFANELRSERAWVRNLFYRIDLSLFLDRALLFASTEQLERGREVLEKQRSLVARSARITSLDAMLGQLETGFSQPGLEFHPEAVGTLLRGIDELLAEWRRWVVEPERKQIDAIAGLLAAGRDANPVLESGGYLASHDGRLLFFFVQPTSSSDEARYLRPFLDAMRGAADRVLAAHPELQGKVKVAFTGMPAHVLTETETVFRDVGGGAIVSALLVVLVIFAGFRTLRKMAIAVVPLVCGLVLSLGAITLVLGRLNLISAAFFAVLFGMSIDFGIYLVRRTEEELGRGQPLAEAVRVAVTQTGKGVLTGGLTTCAAFVAITLSEFQGFAELGVSAGIGVFVCLATVFLLVPAMMLQFGLEPRVADLGRVAGLAGSRRGRQATWAIAAVTAGLVGASLWAAPRNRFDYDALHLLPRDTESTVYQQRMQAESDFSASAAAVVADSLEELRELTARLKALPEVARVESIADLIPEAQAEKLHQIDRLRPLLADLKLQFVPDGTGLSRYRERLAAVSGLFGEAQEAAFNGGRSDLVEQIEKLLSSLEALEQALSQAGDEAALARTRAFEQELFANAAHMLGLVRTWLEARPITEAQFAPEVLGRFKSTRGRYVAYVFPKSSVWDVEALDRFIGQLKEITPRVTGFPATHQVYSRMVVRGFQQSMLYALIALVILLAFDLRRPHAVVLALAPLALAMLVLQLVLWATGDGYNYASVAALPVLLGYGVAYGVNMVQRWMENPGETAFVPAYTVGKGVLLSATTTLAGLVSIVFARHRGVATFGALLLYGIALCLVMAVVVLPAIIDLVYLRKGAQDGKPSIEPDSGSPGAGAAT